MHIIHIMHYMFIQTGILISWLCFFSAEFSKMATHQYLTKGNLPCQMEQLQLDLTEMIDEMRVQMAQFMADIQAMVHGHGLLKEEVSQLKTKVSLVMEVLKIMLKKENNHTPIDIT